MINKTCLKLLILVLATCTNVFVSGQISPGDLSTAHSNLEGLSNCTQCHVLGNKQTNEKCLACHTEMADRIRVKKGYHSSSDVTGKQCSSCHSEHNGKNFQLVRFDTKKFDHNLSGFRLSEPHAKKECKDCHAAKFISDPKLKGKKSTFLGLNTTCLTCHEDYHMRTLSSECLNCHTDNAFKPALKFNHDNARFKLAGRHRSVDCIKCHKLSSPEGKKFQQFTGIQYVNCASCHKDPHQNKFGQNCRQCHSEESFKVIQGTQKFDHNKTAFKLEGKHQIVNCKACHKGSFTAPLKHEKCSDCHADYHKGQFTRNGSTPDCSTCHTMNGYTQFTFSVEQHNQGNFKLKGAHLATPCFECHKKQDKWNFRQIGLNCKECHTDIHNNLIDPKFYPEGRCTVCHNETKWSDIVFDHSVTGFALTGAHKSEGCRVCHFKTYSTGTFVQKFSGLSVACQECHKDNHQNQFAENGVTTCTLCHSTTNWKASEFDHNKTAFKLDGKHAGVACNKCHKPEKDGNEKYILYKIKDFKCESCHF